jgi:serine/threonine protein kinase
MKKFLLILFILLISAAAAGAILLKDGMDKKILILTNGSRIEVDNTWESGDIVFYEIEGEVFLLNSDEVDRVGKADYQYYTQYYKAKASEIVKKSYNNVKSWTKSTTKSMDSNLSVVILIVGATLLCVFVLMIVRAFVGAARARRSDTPEAAQDDDADTEIIRLDIVKYFLKLFKAQIDAPADAPTKIRPLSSKSSGPNYIYELCINDRGEWVKRRMTIGPLGEDTGSKSKCFYVIYDAHLVVKIPTRPIQDFDQYIESINKEGHIVEKLAPKECVIPKVSVILNLIPEILNTDHMSAEKLEEQYINLLRNNPKYEKYQEYLKIKNSFIFFMDFSKFYFLGHIIDNLHDLKDAIPSEVTENPETIGEVSKFKGRYGKINESVFYEIRQVSNICEAEARKYIDDSGEVPSITQFRIQSWFLTHLGGKEVYPKESGVPEKLVPGINSLIRKILESNRAAVDSYRKMIKAYVHKIRLEQNKPQMASISTNLLDLLAWLSEKQVSMRDLKPDNLLVAGNPAKYPLFLMSPEEYSLGIIDVETAVDFEKSKYIKTKQPLLGGTPFYATPSHFFTNEILSHCFGNFRQILHYQDWHAMSVMIYKVVTGDLLFEQTARLFAYVKDKIRHAYANSEQQIAAVSDVSRVFWRSAATEFQVKLAEKEEALKSIEVTVPDNVKQMFLKHLALDRKAITKKMKKAIASQAAFQSDKSRELLLKSSYTKIVQFKGHLKNKFKTKPNPSMDTSNVLVFLDDLAQLKLFATLQQQTNVLLNKPEPKMSTYNILSFMFYTVYHTMFRDDWQNACEPDVCVAEPLDDEATTLEAHP